MKFSLKTEYKKSWKYIKECKRFIYFIVGVFFSFVLIGFFVPLPEVLTTKILEYIQQILDKVKGMNQFELGRFIFFNNLKSSFIGMALGVFFGFYSVLVAVINGVVLGFVGSASVSEAGFSVLWKLVPHGIFELPAVFISLGLGMKLGTFIFKKKKTKFLKIYFWNSLRVFVFVVVPLLIIAAIIEAVLV